MTVRISPETDKRNKYFDEHPETRLVAFMAEQGIDNYHTLSSLKRMFRPSSGYGYRRPGYVYVKDLGPYITKAKENGYITQDDSQRCRLTPQGIEFFNNDIKPALEGLLPTNQRPMVLENVTNNSLGNLIRSNQRLPEVAACLHKLGFSIDDTDTPQQVRADR